MGAIAGLYYLDGQPIPDSHLTQMIQILAHRGSGEAEVWKQGSVGMIQMQLHLSPALKQPKPQQVIPGRDYVITADARLDNREELLAAFQLSDPDHSSISNSELILWAYDRWGEDAPNHLLGAFAYSIWDLGRQRWVCARDHLGEKPFYYCFRPGVLFGFASEIKGLLQVPEIPRQLNPVRVADYLTFLAFDTQSTFYQDILRLPPAHTLVVEAGRMGMARYWSLDPTRCLKLGSDQEYAESLLTIFQRSVQRRLQGVDPDQLGSLLSGGLDSSSVTCLAHQQLWPQGRSVRTLSAVFEDVPQTDERSFIDHVLAREGFQPHFLPGDQIDMEAELAEMLSCLDEPFFGPNSFQQWALLRLARSLGITVLLTGHDGDTVISHGYGYMAELARDQRWLALAQAVWGHASSRQQSFWSLYWIYVRQLGLRHSPLAKPLNWIDKSIRRASGPFRSTSAPNLTNLRDSIRPEFAAQIDLDARVRTAKQLNPNFGLEEKEYHFRLLHSNGLVPLAFEEKDAAAAAYGMEFRHPFFDKEMVEFCLAIPADQKMRQGWSRSILRRALSGIIPDKIQWRRDKADFRHSLIHNLLNQARPEIFAHDKLSALETYVDLNRFHAQERTELLQNLKSSRGAYTPYEMNRAVRFWRLYVLSQWITKQDL